ncbi:hypothetical protein E3A20_27510, partial [Planctomyces bekefii]
MKIRSRIVNLLLSWAAYVVLKLLFLTVRARIYSAVPGVTPYVRPRGEQRYAFPLCVSGPAVSSDMNRS